MAMYEHRAHFSPQGVPIHDASERFTVTFTSNSLKKPDAHQTAHQYVIQQDIVEPYALRNHWEIAEMEVTFENPPWTSYTQLGETLLTFPGTIDYGRNQPDLSEETHLFVTVESDAHAEFIHSVAEYHPPLAPEVVNSTTVQLTLDPQYDPCDTHGSGGL